MDPMQEKNGVENSLFIENEQKLGERLSMRYGIRLSSLHNIGEDIVYDYEEQPNGKLESVDSTYYKKGEVFNPNFGLEPRISLRYKLNHASSVKTSYDRTYQYIHLSTNTASSTPFDLWFLSNPNVKPQYADQFAAGYFRNFANNTIETSVELYYKKMYNAIDFIDHAMLFFNEKLDAELRSGKAYSYGAEFFIRKQQGDFTGWISYTYSKTRRKIKGINDGEEYNAPYDKPHDFKFVGLYDINERISVAANWVYSSPLAYTMATEWFKHENLLVPRYTKRNEVRLKGTAYHRLDVSVTYNFKKRSKFESSLQASVYNAYNRHNLYSVMYEQPKVEGNPPELKKMFLFGIIPTISYNFKF